jgi:hypothetical protein
MTMLRLLKKMVARSVERRYAGPAPTRASRAAARRRSFLPAVEELEEHVVPSGTGLAPHAATTAASAGATPARAPVVTGARAGGATPNSLSSIQVTFSQPVVPATFTAAGVSLVRPNGAVAVASVTPVVGSNNESFTIAFANQTAPGAYTLKVGPRAKSTTGSAVAAYQTTFTIAPPVPTSTKKLAGTGMAKGQTTFTTAGTPIPSPFTGVLTPGKSIASPGGQYHLTLQPDGNLVESNAAGTALWSSGTQGRVVTEMVMQGDGNLVLYNGTRAVWASNTAGNPGAYLSVQDDGDLVIYSGTTPVWATTTAQPVTLLPGKSLWSPNGQYVLTLQTDGNLVESNSAGAALWSSGTGGHAVTAMVMQGDGNLVLYNGSTPVWASNTAGHPGAFLTVQNTGNVVIYSGTTAIWARQPSTLLPGQTLVSPNGEYVLTLQPDGNLVEYNGAGTPLWASGTQGRVVTEMVMQGDGNLVLYDGSTPVWASNTAGHPGASLGLQNNGDLVISSAGTQVWTADLTLRQNGILLPGESLSSPNGQYVLTLQTDGNLVEYNAAGTPRWASGTAGKTVTEAIMQGDGNLVLYDGSTPVWASNTAGHPGAFLSLGNDGSIVIAAGASRLWVR